MPRKNPIENVGMKSTLLKKMYIEIEQDSHIIMKLCIMSRMNCVIKNVDNLNTLHTLSKLEQIVDVIIIYNKFTVLEKVTHTHEKLNLSLMCILKECHISLKTFPEKSSLEFSIDFFPTCDNENSYQIFEFLVQSLNADLKLSTLKID